MATHEPKAKSPQRKSSATTKSHDAMKSKAKDFTPIAEKVLYDNRIKRKNVLALNEKVAAIREYEKMPVYKRIGRMFHCSPDQIKRIVQQKDGILKAWEQRTRRCQDAKTLEMKVVRVSMLGKAVYDWIRRMMYYKDLMITDGLIQKMALQFKSAMGLQNFFPYQDWCDKFRQTYNITVNDSKMLKIGYTQGYSVQIKDVMKDVLSECTPDTLVECMEDGDENDAWDENDIQHFKQEEDSEEDESSLSANSKVASHTNFAMTARPIPKLQPLGQIVALPIQTSSIGMPQKVLVATPISKVGQVPNATPMTMTIIPLTTIAQSKSIQYSDGKVAVAKKQVVPAPILDIKPEIKQEPGLLPEGISIKQECLSDEEETAVGSTHTESETTTKHNDAVMAIADDNLPLSSLKRIIQQQKAPATESIDNGREAVSQSSGVTKETCTKSASKPIPTRMNCALNRRSCKRKQSAETGLAAIKSCAEARRYLKLLEDFALVKENFRLIGLITRADEVLRELDGDDDIDVD